MSDSPYRNLPSVDSLAGSPALAEFHAPLRVLAARQAIAEAREKIAKNEAVNCESRASEIAKSWTNSNFPLIINCTGTIINTGLGRSVVDFINPSSHLILETDIETGERGDRQLPLQTSLCKLTGAEAAYVVNNNAAAVMLVLNSLCTNKQVLLSRGQSVEIGGSFRMPDVIRISEVGLVDVGCTNKTRISDYENAINQNTAAILRCHPSNFIIKGFVEEPTINQLVECAHKNNILMIDDNGSGCLINTEQFGLPHEPTLQEAVKSGADIVTASGDKLLGGPQAGIILGKKQLIEKIAKNPLARALRIDKFTAQALDYTLKQYLIGNEKSLPTIAALAKTKQELAELAKNLTTTDITIEDSICEVGGGSMPGVEINSICLSVKSNHPNETAKQLRRKGVFGYVKNDSVKLELRTVLPHEWNVLETAIKSLS